MSYEDSSEGWVLFSYQPNHVVRGETDDDGKPVVAHELEQDVAAVRSRSTGRSIPDDLIPIGKVMAKAGMGAAHIKDVFDSHANDLGIDSTQWNYQDIREAFPASLTKREFDAKGLVELLQKRQSESGAGYFAETDECGFLKRVFAQLDDSAKEWARTPDANIVLFDPTHGTNRYGMKLCCFTTVGPTGQTVILAVALIKYEDKWDIEWALKCFQKIFKTPPLAFYTDSAAAIETAFQMVSATGQPWEKTRHVLCVYHLSKNLYTNLRPLFVTNPETWKKIHSMFWDLAKNSDATFADEETGSGWDAVLDSSSDEFIRIQKELIEAREGLCVNRTFTEAWKALYLVVEEDAVGSTKDAGLSFLQKLFDNRRKWAACYTWNHTTWGVNSTQRAEAIHSAIKRKRSLANFALVKLIEMLLQHNRDARHRKAVDEVRQRINQVGKNATVPPWVEEIQSKVTPYAYELVLAQIAQALKYETIDTGLQIDGCQVYEVKRVGTVAAFKTPGVEFDAEDCPNCNDDDEDFGLGPSRYVSTRLTTINRCSCQLGTSLQVPCRHMLCLRILLQVGSGATQRAIGMLELMGRKWHSFTEKQEVEKVRELLRRTAFVASAPVGETMTRNERYTLLVHELASLAELGAESEDTMDQLLSAIPQLSLQICSQDKEPQSEATPSGASGRARDGRTEEQDKRQSNGQSNETQQEAVVPRKESRDYKNLLATLGSRFIIDDTLPPHIAFTPGSAEGLLLVGRCFAMKYGKKNTGNWYVGKIIGQYDEEGFEEGDEDDEEPADGEEDGESPADGDEEGDGPDGGSEDFTAWNFLAEYITGNESELLEYGTHITFPELYNNADLGRWTLLSEAPLGQDVQSMAQEGTLHNPQLPVSAKGRKRYRRYKPTHGPGSQKAKGKHSTKAHNKKAHS